MLLREFSVRKGSGGVGKFNGGDGVIRELEFLKVFQCCEKREGGSEGEREGERSEGEGVRKSKEEGFRYSFINMLLQPYTVGILSERRSFGMFTCFVSFVFCFISFVSSRFCILYINNFVFSFIYILSLIAVVSTEPPGLLGGGAAKRGENILIRRDGKRVNLGGKNEVDVAKGDVVRIMTPGGGAYGKA